MIAEGLRELGLSAEGEELSELHLEGGIAACHSLAERYEATGWPRILRLYDIPAVRSARRVPHGARQVRGSSQELPQSVGADAGALRAIIPDKSVGHGNAEYELNLAETTPLSLSCC